MVGCCKELFTGLVPVTADTHCLGLVNSYVYQCEIQGEFAITKPSPEPCSELMLCGTRHLCGSWHSHRMEVPWGTAKWAQKWLCTLRV